MLITNEKITDINKQVYQIQTERRVNKLNEQEKYQWVNANYIDLKTTAKYLHQLKDDDKLYRFTLKARRSHWLDKATRYTLTNQHATSRDFWIKRHRNIKVDTPQCDRCGIIEDSNHYLVCTESTHLLSELTNEIEALLISKLTDMPKMWIMEPYWKLTKTDEELQIIYAIKAPIDFPAQLAGTAIPTGILQQMKKLKWRENINAETVLLQIQRMITTTHHQMWIARCNVFYPAHPRILSPNNNNQNNKRKTRSKGTRPLEEAKQNHSQTNNTQPSQEPTASNKRKIILIDEDSQENNTSNNTNNRRTKQRRLLQEDEEDIGTGTGTGIGITNTIPHANIQKRFGKRRIITDDDDETRKIQKRMHQNQRKQKHHLIQPFILHKQQILPLNVFIKDQLQTSTLKAQDK